MRRHITVFYRRRMGGRRKSRARMGWVPVVLFVALCVIAAIAGILIERKLQSLAPVQRTGDIAVTQIASL